MPVEIERDRATGIVNATVTGQFEGDELNTALAPYYAKAPRGMHLFFTIDFRGLDAPPASEALIKALMKAAAVNPKVPALGAFVSEEDMGFAPGKLILPIYSKIGLKAMVFATPDEAKRWLLSGLE